MAALRRRSAAAPAAVAAALPAATPASAPDPPWITLREAALVAALAALSFVNATEGGWAIDDPRSFAGNRDVVGELVAPPVGAETLDGGGSAEPGSAEPAQGDDGSKDPYMPSSGVAVGVGIEDLPPGSRLQPQPLAQVWADDFWGEPMASANSHKSYRPLTVLSFRLSYVLWSAVLPSGGLGAAAQRAYHAENVALHALVSVLFLAAVRRAAPQQPRSVGLGAAALFAAHAVHCEAVANVTGRAELLAAAFFLASFLAYPIDRYSAGDADSAEPAPSIALPRLLGSIALAVLAMLAKEPGVTVFGLSVLVEGAAILSFVQHHRQQQRRRQQPGAATGPGGTKSPLPATVAAHVYRLIVRSVVVASVGGGALAWRLSLNNGQKPRFSDGANPAALTAPDPTTRWLTHAHIWVQSYWLVVWPLHLSVDWGYGSIPLISSWTDERNLLTALGFLVVGAAAWWSARRMPHTATAAWVAMLLLPFLPASNLFFPVGFVIAERIMYLPSLGFCMLAALFCLGSARRESSGSAGRRSKPNTKGNAAGGRASQPQDVAAAATVSGSGGSGSTWWVRGFVCLVAANLLRTWARNEDWRDCHSLWLSSAEAVPTNEFLPLALGECILERYSHSSSSNDSSSSSSSGGDVVVNGGDVGVHEDDDEAESKRLLSLAMGEAMAAYRAALRINPSYGAATVALAKLLHIEKRYEEEEHVLRSTLTHAGFARDSDVRAVGGGREWRDMMVKLVRTHTQQKADRSMAFFDYTTSYFGFYPDETKDTHTVAYARKGPPPSELTLRSHRPSCTSPKARPSRMRRPCRCRTSLRQPSRRATPAPGAPGWSRRTCCTEQGASRRQPRVSAPCSTSSHAATPR